MGFVAAAGTLADHVLRFGFRARGAAQLVTLVSDAEEQVKLVVRNEDAARLVVELAQFAEHLRVELGIRGLTDRLDSHERAHFGIGR